MSTLSSILAFELCLPFDATLHAGLRQFTAGAPRMRSQEKWQQYTGATALLRQYLGSAWKGCWDYFDDDTRARHDFEQWSQGMITAEGVRPGPLDEPSAYRAEPRFMTFTMAFLLVQNSPCDLSLRRLCDIPKSQLWQRTTFARILEGLGWLNFASIRGDVLYLIPRDPPWALTAADLEAEKFEYLRIIE